LVFALLFTYVRQKSSMNTDTIIGVFSSGAMALGIFLSTLGGQSFSKFNTLLIGDILSVAPAKIALLALILLVILLTMGVVAQEKERGTAAMLLTKPVRRSAVILAKWLTGMTIVLAGLLVDGLACLAYTAVLFEPIPFGSFWTLNLLLLIYLGVYLTVALMASTLARSQSIAAAGAFGGLIVLLVLGSIPRVSDYMPGQLVAWGSSLVLRGDITAWPALGVSVGIIALALFVACLRFEREEI